MSQTQFLHYLEECWLGFKEKIDGSDNLPKTLQEWLESWQRFMDCEEPFEGGNKCCVNFVVKLCKK